MAAAPLGLHIIHTCQILNQAMFVLNEKLCWLSLEEHFLNTILILGINLFRE